MSHQDRIKARALELGAKEETDDYRKRVNIVEKAAEEVLPSDVSKRQGRRIIAAVLREINRPEGES